MRLALAAGVVLLSSGIASGQSNRIKTPFQLVPLWSEEMLDYLIGVRQASCSGPDAPACKRLNAGVCDATAYFKIGPSSGVPEEVPFRKPDRQTGAGNPQYFELQIRNAGYSGVTRIFNYSPAQHDAMELVFNCNYSGNDGCPAERFQTGSVRRVELSVRDSEKTFDVTHSVKVLPDGPIAVPVDRTLKTSLFTDPAAVYQVRVIAECFSVEPIPHEWTIPVYASSEGNGRLGAIVVRATPGTGMDFFYQPEGVERRIPFDPDWIAPDWGYTFLMDQTVLDQKGDWFQLPPRPFPNAVWVHLPGRELNRVTDGDAIYVLSRKVRARPAGTRDTLTLDEGNYVIERIDGRTAEIRKEEAFDMSCGEAVPPRPSKLQTYLVDVGEFYDADLHLRLTIAYPKGC